MPNFFERKIEEEDSDESEKTESKKAVFNAVEFFDEYGKAIKDYAEDGGLIFRVGPPGEQSSIDLEKGEVSYDLNLFAKENCSPDESMVVLCHEMEHFRSWRRDPEAYRRLFARMQTKRRIKVLYNSLEDIEAYGSVDSRFPSLKPTRERRQREKLFPGTNYSNQPKHLQFAYAMYRESKAALPEEILKIDKEVREEVEKLKNIDGKETDLISLVSDPEAKPGDRFEIIRDYIEPIYEKFFKEDVEEKKKQEQKGEGEGEGEGGGEEGEKKEGKPKKDEDYFKDEYDDFDSKSPEPIKIDDIKDTLDKEVKRKKEETQKTPEQIANEQFEKEHGVFAKDVENYRYEYEKIRQYIEPLREIFERIISKRKEIKRRLKERTDQGVILDPSLVSQAYIDAQSGVLDSRTQLKIRKEEYDENKPNNFEFTLICDLSGSMQSPNTKETEQRLSAILISEALAEFEEKLKTERLEKHLDLHVMTEMRGFSESDEELKPMSDTIDYKTRVEIAKRLQNCNGGSTRDFESLAKIDKDINEETRGKIEKNDLKKIILMITDGGSDDVRQAKKEKESLAKSGVITKAIQIGEVSDSDKEKFKEVWQKPKKDGYSCKDVSNLVLTIEKLLEEFLENL